MWMLIIAAALCAWAFLIHHELTQLRLLSETAWSDLATHLTHRHTLIQQFIDALTRSDARQSQACQPLITAHAQATRITAPHEKAVTERALTSTLSALFASIDHSIQLRTNEEVMDLRQSLTKLDSVWQAAGQYHNTLVQDYNTRLTAFPDRLVAHAGKFQPKALFQPDDASRDPV